MRPVELRHVCFVAALIAAAIGCLTGCAVSPQLNFAWNSKQPLTTLHPVAGQSQFYAGSVLGVVPATCLTGLQVQYTATNFLRDTETEAVLFALSPDMMEQELLALGDKAKLNGAWQTAASMPGMIPNPLSLSVALQPGVTSAQLAPVTATPTLAAFWGAQGPGNPALPVCTNVDGIRGGAVDASIQTTIVYYHGMCGAVTNLTDTLGEIVDDLFDQFKESAVISGPQSHYRHALSILEEGSFTDEKESVGVPGSDVRGGFLLTFHFRANLFDNNNEVWGTYKYRFSLQDGFLAISDDDIQQLSLDSSGAWGWKFKDGMRDGLKKDLPKGFNEQAIQAQQIDFSSFGLTCSKLTDCASISSALAFLITSDSFKNLNLPAPTSAQLTSLKCAVGSQSDCSLLGRTANLQAIWNCAPIKKGKPQPNCQFRLPAKRLLAFPDQLELVWFDDMDFNNPVFAIFLLAPAEQRDTLCSAAPGRTGASGLQVRDFASVGRVGN